MSDNITLYPVVGWETATLPDASAMLALRYLPGIPSKPLTNEQAHALAEVHRFAMTAAQCDELALVLQNTARQSRARQTSAS